MQVELMELIGGWLGQSAKAISEAITEVKKEGDKDVSTLKPATEIKAYLQPLFEEKVRAVKKAGHDEGHGRGKREALDTTEKEIAEKFALKKDSVLNMFSSYAEKQKADGGKVEVTPELIRTSDIYIADMKAKAGELTTIKSEFEKFKEEQLTAKQIETGRKKIDPLFKGFQLPDPEKFSVQRNNRMKAVENAFFQKYRINSEGDKDVIIDVQTGKPALDVNFNPVSIKDAFAGVASQTLLPADPAAVQTPGGTTTPPTTAISKFPEIKSHNDYYAQINTVKPEDLKDFQEHYEKLVKEGKVV